MKVGKTILEADSQNLFIGGISMRWRLTRKYRNSSNLNFKYQ